MAKPAGIVAVLVVSALLAGGCLTTPERPPLTAYYQYDYGDAVKKFREDIKQVKEKEEQNIVLANVNYAGAAFVGGDYRGSLEGFRAASQIMEDVEYGAQRGQASMVLAHGMRVYKGEPYERAMAYTYMGLVYLRRGDLDNARAALNLALLADRSSKGDKEEYRDDFALGHYLIGKTFLKLGEADNAQISFDKVKKYMPKNPFADPAQSRDSNFTLLVEMGCGPSKHPDPFVGTVDMIAVCKYPERYAEVWVDGTKLGRTAQVVDLNRQAKTSGHSQRDTAQAAKGVAVTALKHAPFVGGLIGLVADTTGVSKADLRHWPMLPGEVHVLEAKLAPGLHTLQLKFFDDKGKELERFQQTHYYVPVREPAGGAVPVHLVRSGLDRHNEVRPVAAEYLALGPAMLNQQLGGPFGGFGGAFGLATESEKPAEKAEK
jgi:tetratricopeptide (TPR) repeat protein